MELAARLAVAVLLLGAAAAKVRAWGELPDLLGGYGVPSRLRRSASIALVAAEGVVGALLLAGVATRPAALAALGLGVAFVLALTRARLRGARRLRCGCFGSKERSTTLLLVRAVAFSALAGFAALAAFVDVSAPSRDTLVVIALGVLGLAVVVLAALVLALYRQVGVLTLRIAPRAVLELADEGPAVGQEAPPLAGLERRGAALVAFFSPDCRLCRELAPAIRALEREGLGVRVVSETEEADAFALWTVPGTPFAVHVVDGVVGAKGAVNTLEQLDALVAGGTLRTHEKLPESPSHHPPPDPLDRPPLTPRSGAAA
jgi:hypothetical protein